MLARSLISNALLLLTTLVAVSLGSEVGRGSLLRRQPKGPVISENFPDPGLVKVKDTWYAFASRTKGTTIHIQMASSKDFENWSIVKNPDGSQKDALPELPQWVNKTDWQTWAPNVAEISPNRFVMYYAAITNKDPSGKFHCIGWAVADNIEGPYKGSDEAFICPLDRGGAIDPSAFQDEDGKRYVVYKDEGNAIGHGGPCGNTEGKLVDTWLVLRPLEDDGTTKAGEPIHLLNHQGVSDDGIIENPDITRTADGKYVLFFSSGCFVTDRYTVSYAFADKITGPYTRQPRPLYKTGDNGLIGPGGPCVSRDAKHMIFHAYLGDPSRFVRGMFTAMLKVDGNNTLTAE